MKVVFDTNVLMAALISRGTCADLLEQCVMFHSIITSDFILDELREHLVGKFRYSVEEAEDAVSLFKSQMQLVTPEVIEPQVCRDKDDDQILGTGLAGLADCIVTGDKDLLVVQQHAGIEIITPGDFVDFETKRSNPST